MKKHSKMEKKTKPKELEKKDNKSSEILSFFSSSLGFVFEFVLLAEFPCFEDCFRDCFSI